MAQINIAGTLHNTEEIQGDALNSHVVAHADEILDSTQEKKQSEVNADVDTALANRYTKEETYNKTELDNLITTPDVQYVTVATYSALPATGEADTIYRVASWDGTAVDAGKYSEYAWNGSAYQLLAVRSGSLDGVFDISANNLTEGQPTKYADLSAALGTNGANVPVGVRVGGMQVRFINSSTGKYEQWRLMAASWSTTVSDWQGIDSTPTAESQNLVTSGGVSQEIAKINGGVIQNIVTHVTQGTSSQSSNYPVSIPAGTLVRLFVNTNSVAGHLIFIFRYNSTYDQKDVPASKFGTYVEYTTLHDITDVQCVVQSGQALLTGDVVSNVSYPEKYALKSYADEISGRVGTLETTTGTITGEIGVLQSNVDILDGKVDELSEDIEGLPPAQEYNAFLTDLAWTNIGSDGFSVLVMPVTPGSTLIITRGEKNCQYGLLKTFSLESTPDFSSASGYTGRNTISSTEPQTIIVPSDVHYLAVNALYKASSDYTPSSVTMDGVDILHGTASLPEQVELLNTRVTALEEEEVSLQHNVLKFIKNSNKFEFWQFNGLDKWFKFDVELCVNNDADFYQYLWRLTHAYLYKKVDGVMTQITTVIATGENEYASAFTNFSASGAYVGGVHGGERIAFEQNDPNASYADSCFVKFFADGKLLDLTNDFEIECNEFCYLQKSTMHIVNDSAQSPKNVVEGHPVFAYHTKITNFKDCGYKTENTLEVLESLRSGAQSFAPITSTNYFSLLSCIGKGTAMNVMFSPGIVTQMVGTSQSQPQYNSDNPSDSRVITWNNDNDLVAEITSSMEQGLTEADVNTLKIWDRANDSKYYRGVYSEKNLSAIGIIRSGGMVIFR